MKVSTRSRTKFEGKVNFGGAFESAEHMIHVLVEKGVVEETDGEIINAMFTFFNLWVNKTWLQEMSSAFSSASSTSFTRGSMLKLNVCIAMPSWLFFFVLVVHTSQRLPPSLLYTYKFFCLHYRTLLGNLVIEVCLGRCWKVWTLSAINFSIRTLLLVRRKTQFWSLRSTSFFTRHFLIGTEGRHLSNFGLKENLDFSNARDLSVKICKSVN